jgi:hypothetical protein
VIGHAQHVNQVRRTARDDRGLQHPPKRKGFLTPHIGRSSNRMSMDNAEAIDPTTLLESSSMDDLHLDVHVRQHIEVPPAHSNLGDTAIANGDGTQPTPRRGGATTISECDRKPSVSYIDAPFKTEQVKRCCRSIGINIRITNVVNTGTHIKADIDAFFHFKILRDFGLPTCKIEKWEYASQQATTHGKGGTLVPKLNSAGRNFNEVDQWTEVANMARPVGPNRDFHPSPGTKTVDYTPADDYDAEQKRTLLGGRHYWDYEDEPRGPIEPGKGFYLYQVYRQKSGCAGPTHIAEAWIRCDDQGNCETSPRESDSGASMRGFRPNPSVLPGDTSGHGWTEPSMPWPNHSSAPIPRRPPQLWEKIYDFPRADPTDWEKT